MDTFLIILLLITSLSWNVMSLLVKEGLYYTTPLSSMFVKSLVFFLIAMCILAYFKFKGTNIFTSKTKKALRFYFVAVLLTFFLGTYPFLKMLKQAEKISLVIFLQSVFTLILVSILSYFFLNERYTWTQILGMIIGLIGTGIIIFNSNVYKKN